ncbi:hypothetical protein PM082_023552 [Marasmius tenuissimus]|nr:hypothetical protein PM082_023552 [Marasmius tenuissimus]
MSNITSLNHTGVQTLGYGAGGGGVEKCCVVHPPERLATRPRNLVVCIDGTSNKFGKNNSNVIELYSRLVKDDSQLTYYNSGIGTYAKPSWRSFSYYKKRTAHIIDMAIAWWFEKRIIEAYRWLSENFKKGDRIFLFGFSRGAYQVRVLSAMINKVGLIHRGNDDQIPFAYELYSKCTDDHTKQTDEASHFKTTFSRDVQVHFVGAWDTVSSVGLFPKTLPLTTTGMDHVCFFRHALALDERRGNFVPEYAGGLNKSPNNLEAQVNGFPLSKKEVWFAGTHSDIGGGATENERLTSNGPALRWMIRESIEAGLSLNPFSGEWGRVHRKSGNMASPSRLWIALEILPGKKSLLPHLGRRRPILKGQRIHQSVYALGHDYYSSRLPTGFQDSQGVNVEQDKFDDISQELHQCVEDWCGKPPISDDDVKNFMSSRNLPEPSSKDGRLAYQNLFESLKNPLHSNDPIGTTAKMNMLCHVASHFPKCYAGDLPPGVKSLLRASPPSTAAQEFVKKFSHAGSFKIYLDAEIKALSISKGGSFYPQPAAQGRPYYLAVASAQTVIPIYNLSTNQVIQTLRGHTRKVETVSFSPSMTDFRSLTLVSGSTVDGTIRVWNVNDGSQWESTNAGHKGGTLSVSFSSDGKHIVSGGLDCFTNIWEVNSAGQNLTPSCPIEGHTNRVLSVAISPNCSRVVSVSKDTVCLWDYNKRSQGPIETIKRRHCDPKDVIFLSENAYFLYASLDGDLIGRRCEDGVLAFSEQMKLPLGVSPQSLAFEEDQLACGLSDGRILVWTVQLALGKLELTKQRVYDYHLDDTAPSSVTSLVFSDDLTRLVAGYEDGYVVGWYAQGIEGILRELSDGYDSGPSSGGRVVHSAPHIPQRPTSNYRTYSEVSSPQLPGNGLLGTHGSHTTYNFPASSHLPDNPSRSDARSDISIDGSYAESASHPQDTRSRPTYPVGYRDPSRTVRPDTLPGVPEVDDVGTSSVDGSTHNSPDTTPNSVVSDRETAMPPSVVHLYDIGTLIGPLISGNVGSIVHDMQVGTPLPTHRQEQSSNDASDHTPPRNRIVAITSSTPPLPLASSGPPVLTRRRVQSNNDASAYTLPRQRIVSITSSSPPLPLPSSEPPLPLASSGPPVPSRRRALVTNDPSAYMPPRELMKIQDMDDLQSSPPRMPAVLADYGVDSQDWDHLVQELKSTWFRQLPASSGPDAQLQTRLFSMETLLGSWNHLVFNKKGVSLVLYKGRECCSGPQKGQIDRRIPLVDESYRRASPTLFSESGYASGRDDDEETRFNNETPDNTSEASDEAERTDSYRDEQEEQKRRIRENREEEIVRQIVHESEARYTLYVTESVPEGPTATHSFAGV